MDKPVHTLPQPRLPSVKATAIPETSDGAIRAELGKPRLARRNICSRRAMLLLWRVTRLRRKAEEARRHKSQYHLCRHDRPARGGGFGTAVKMRAEDTSIAQTELDALP